MTVKTEQSVEACEARAGPRPVAPAPTGSALGRLLAQEPPGLAPSSSRGWRARTMAEAGHGWEDIVVASRRWACGPMPPARARALVMELGGVSGPRGGG